MGRIRRIYIDQRLTHQGFFGLKGVRIPTRPKLIVNRIIGPLIKLCQKRGKVARLNEACGFPSGRLEEQTRGRCPHILALTNTRTALRAWREDSGDITRILLTAMAGLLAQQGARISDAITLCTRILLAA